MFPCSKILSWRGTKLLYAKQRAKNGSVIICFTFFELNAILLLEFIFSFVKEKTVSLAAFTRNVSVWAAKEERLAVCVFVL